MVGFELSDFEEYLFLIYLEKFGFLHILGEEELENLNSKKNKTLKSLN